MNLTTELSHNSTLENMLNQFFFNLGLDKLWPAYNKYLVFYIFF